MISITFRRLCVIILMEFGYMGYTQTIINTENMMSALDDKFSYHMNIRGDMNFGNIDLIQFSTAQQISKSLDKNLLRLIFNYDYIEQNGIQISSDFTGQLRYNYRLGQHSIFAFVQGQNIKSLRMNHRYITGGGYRHRVFQKEDNYWDLSLGLFFEDELYDANLNTVQQVNNWRYSVSTFIKYGFSEKFSGNLSLYWQINTSYTRDYRVFLEPRLYYSIQKFDVFIDWTFRFHSTPYIDVLRQDSTVNLGIEFELF
ncbi:DUF481 domain-containing protein [Flagellimonas marinaquae]|uniref:DUF481 domain-containing protein n=1 Tax=Flagellimonas marinaquae TaxID=254955 RepID=UPI000F8F2821|nr:DUF481 domain-containing protein [Allomuricauda aquimarina]